MGRQPDRTRRQIPCPSCRSPVPVPPGAAGKAGRCPTCEARVTFPADPGDAKPVPKAAAKVAVRCGACGTKLSVDAKFAGKRVKCPKCSKPVAIPDNRAAPPPSAADDGGDLTLEDAPDEAAPEKVDRRAYNAWAELQKEKEDSYWVATLRAFLYPFQALGVVIFFVLGIPLAVALLRAGADHLLRTFPTTELGAGNPVATAIVVVSLLVFAAAAGLVASFLFAIVRISAVGSKTVPVIQGAHHRLNLGAFGAWMAVYFGPGILLGMHSAEPGALWTPSIPAVAVLLLLGLLAPMGLLMGAMHGGTWALRFPTLFQALGRLFGPYAYLLLLWGVATALFCGAGWWLDGVAAARMTGEEPDYITGTVLRLASGCFFVFPAVALARMLGIFACYHRDRLPFKLQGEETGRGSLVNEAVLLAALVLVFFPLNRFAEVEAVRWGVMERCNRNLEDIVRQSYTGRGYDWPRNEEELKKRFPKRSVCPLNPDEPIGYEVFEVRGHGGEPDGAFVIIADKAGNHPDGSRNILTYGGKVAKGVSASAFERIMELQQEVLKNPDNPENGNKLREMRFLRGF